MILTCSNCEEAKTIAEFPGRVRSGGTVCYGRQCKACRSKRTMSYAKRNPEKTRVYNRVARLKKKHGLSVDDVRMMEERQKGKCAICSEPIGDAVVTRGDRTLAIDHCHRSGKVRGILCRGCNVGLGCFHDRHDLLIRASLYLVDDLRALMFGPSVRGG